MFDGFYFITMGLITIWLLYRTTQNCIKVDRECAARELKFKEFVKEFQNKNTKYIYNGMIEIKDKDPALYEALCLFLGQQIIESYQNGNLSKYIS